MARHSFFGGDSDNIKKAISQSCTSNYYNTQEYSAEIEATYIKLGEAKTMSVLMKKSSAEFLDLLCYTKQTNEEVYKSRLKNRPDTQDTCGDRQPRQQTYSAPGKSDFTRLFERKKSHLDSQIKRDYVKNGVATIFCQISDYHDVITAYGVKNHETVNPDFIENLSGAAAVIPDECPLVLNIIEDCLSKEEQETIRQVIRDDFAYDFGIAEQEFDKLYTEIAQSGKEDIYD